VRFGKTGVTFVANNGEKVPHQVAHDFIG